MENTIATKKYFTAQLISWHAATNSRSLPWKNEKDPYKIWLSEVILQQTRALQGLPYYLRFTETFPRIEDMGAADDDHVFRLWQGLGYYNRCKNMLATARYIANELHGKFPESYEGLLELRGIGPYTAAAIASFAYGLPNAVVDGNVYRVLARYFGIDIPFDTTEGKNLFALLAQELLYVKDSAAYNQAIMDLGATVCSPRSPLCAECPLKKKCIACHNGLTESLPVRSKKQSVRKRYFHYLLLQWQDKLWIHKRTEKDIWQNLHQPFLIESSQAMEIGQITQHDFFKDNDVSYSSIIYNGAVTQRLTHRIIESRFYSIKLPKKPKMRNLKGSWLDANDLKKTAFPKTIVSFLEKNLYF